MSDITLNATERATLLSLQDASSLYSRTQVRLNTNKKVNSATDDPVAYYRSQSLSNRATTLTTVKSNIDQNIQSLNSAMAATSQVQTLLQQMLAIVQGAQSGSVSQRISATTQFKNIANQMAQLVYDTTYQGLNMLSSSTAELITQFSDRTASTYTIPGYNLVDSIGGSRDTLFTQASAVFNNKGVVLFSAVVGNAAGVGGSPTTSISGFSQLALSASSTATIPGSQAYAIITATENRLNAAISQIEAVTESLGTNVGILQDRANFTSSYSNDLTSGSNALTLADLNTEAANSQALELRQQLGIQSLSVSSTISQAVLQLLK
jgi:flagellin-like hook-associated protein FlgL